MRRATFPMKETLFRWMNTAKLNFASTVAVIAIAAIGLYGWAAHLDILTRFVPAS
jgi:type IV secretory pathway VirB2 component (pilin)